MHQQLKNTSDEISSRLDDVIESALKIDSSGLPAKVRVVLSNGLLVFLAAVIEDSVRDLVKSYLLVLEKNIISPDQLPPKLIQNNYKSIGERIKVLSRAKDINAQRDLLQVFESVNEAHISGGTVPFDLKRLTLNQSNMKSSQVTDIFSRVGVNLVWKNLSQMLEVTNYFPTAQQKQVESQLITKWNSLFDERDVIMHNNSNSNGIGAPAISNYATFFKVCLGCQARFLDGAVVAMLH